jgi:anthranilate synthase component 2
MATAVPDCLQAIANYQHIPMAISHAEHRVLGFQFHPESILTTLGKPLLAQSLAYLTGQLSASSNPAEAK